MIGDCVYDVPKFQTKQQLRQKIIDVINNINSMKRNIVLDLFSNFRRRLGTVIEKRGNLYNK